MGKVLKMTYASSLTNLCEINSSFDTGILRICYTGENRNGSAISKSVLEKCVPTLFNCPIVCNYDRESDTLGGHDMEIVRESDGGLRLVNSTQPIGVIAESSNIWFEDFEEEDGTVHEYLCAEVLLWKRQEAYKKIKADGITAHSMEITVKKGKKTDGIYHITDFEFTAFCLLGVEPCYEGAALETFSKADFKEQLSEMMQDLKETFALINHSDEVDNTHPQNSMEGGEKALDKKMELVAKYGIDINTLDFSIEDLSVEELEAKFAAMAQEPEQESEDEIGEPHNEEFELTNNILTEIRMAISAEKVQCDWGEFSRYLYADCDLDTHEVYVWDELDWLLYGFNYTLDGDKVVVDFESKKRMKYAIVAFDEGEQTSPFVSVFEMMSKKIEDCSGYEAKFNEASENIASMETELAELRNFKMDVEKEAAKAERDEVFAQFEDLAGVEAFEALRENCEEFELDVLEDKCFAIRGRVGTPAKFSADQKKTTIVKVDKPDSENEPYGGLFTKYATGRSN